MNVMLDPSSVTDYAKFLRIKSMPLFDLPPRETA